MTLLPLADRPARPRWLELALDYRCNLRCVGCRACLGEGGAMSSQQALSWLRWGRLQRIERLWLGGGEPTLRPELPSLCKAARQLGYSEVVVQTNGLRLAYPAFAQALSDAGATGIRLNIKTHDAEEHDRLSSEPGAHARLEEALTQIAALPMTLAADLLLTDSTTKELAATVAHYASRGVRSFSLWLLSAADDPTREVAQRIPRIADVAQQLGHAAEAARSQGASIETLHTPPCALPAELRALWKPAAAWGLVVVDPAGRPFSLDRSPFEGGSYLPTCAACARRRICPGIRADYMAEHGAQEFTPIPA